MQSKQNGVYVVEGHVQEKSLIYKGIFKNDKKNWIERRQYIGKKVKGSFIAKGKTVRITERER